MLRKYLLAAFMCVLVIQLTSCSSSQRAASDSGVHRGSPVATKESLVRVDTILAEFPECSKERAVFYKSDSVLTFAVWGPKDAQVAMSIAPDGKYVAFVEIAMEVMPGAADKLSDERLEPMQRLLGVLFPDWDGVLSWLRTAFKKMPYSEARGNWKLKVWRQPEGALALTATQDLDAGRSDAETDPRLFESLVVANGKPIVTAASVEDDKGKALTRETAKYLAIWVSTAWYRFSEPEKNYFIKLHVDVFNEWKGDDKGTVIIFDDYLDKELGWGTQRVIKLSK